MAEQGLGGLEVAPSRVWHDTWKGLTAADVDAYRSGVEAAGLRVLGLHSLFFDHPDLGLFKGPEQRSETMEFLVHLSAVCRDLGGCTLIYGGGRNRGETTVADATAEALDFIHELTGRIELHGTIICFEPLGPGDSEFINSANEALNLVREVNHPSFRMQLDAKALVENDEADRAAFEQVKPYLVHFHANEPGLNPLQKSGPIDHKAVGRFLRDIGYSGFVSIEQRMVDPGDPFSSISNSIDVLKEYYS